MRDLDAFLADVDDVIQWSADAATWASDGSHEVEISGEYYGLDWQVERQFLRPSLGDWLRTERYSLGPCSSEDIEDPDHDDGPACPLCQAMEGLWDVQARPPALTSTESEAMVLRVSLGLGVLMMEFEESRVADC